MVKRGIIAQWVVAACCLVVGCKGGLIDVEGRVTLDGEPLVGARVGFVPDAQSTGRPALGETDGEGRFFLGTLQTRDGAAPGIYKVIITKLQKSNFPATPPAKADAQADAPKDINVEMEEARAYFAKHRKKLKGKSLLPARYGEVSQTPLTVTLPARGPLVLEVKTAE